MPWIFAIVLGIVLSLANGLPGFLVGAGLGLAGGFFLRWKFFPKKKENNSKSHKQPPPVPKTRPPSNSRVSGDIQWIRPNESIRIGNFRYDGGLVFAAKGNRAMTYEPSTIFLGLPFQTKGTVIDEELGYYPSYEKMYPNQRAIYLEWLASGRRDSDPSVRQVGYVFCFFYGLERRLLLDRDRDPMLRAEVQELLKMYGGQSGSIRSYFTDLLHLDGYNQGVEQYRSLWPNYLNYTKYLDGEALKLILANLHQRGEPLHWTVALRVAPRLDGTRHSVVIERSGDKFWKLFQQRFEEAYPDGMILKAAKRDVWSEYRPASSALLQMTYHSRNHSFRVSVPHVMGIRSQFKTLVSIWNQCIEDLSGYSRAMAGESGEANEQALKAFLKLPDELRKPDSHPFHKNWTRIITGCEKEGDLFFLPVSVMAELFGIAFREKLTLTQSRKLAEHIDGLGYQLAPDPRVTGLPLAWNQECAVYLTEKSHANPSKNLVGFIRMLYLTIAIADADGSVDPEEVAVFESIAREEVTCDHERIFLEATGAALLRDTTVAMKSLNRIAGGVAPARRPLIARYIIQVAAADGVITPEEHKVLKTAFRKFDLPADFLEQQMTGDSETFTEVTVVKGKKSNRRGEAIPSRPDEKPPENVFQLDMSKIASITAETDQIVKVLSEIMDEEEANSELKAEPEVVGGNGKDESFPSWMEELDSPYRKPLTKMIQWEEFSEKQLEELATESHLLPADLISKVNLWSDEALGDFLIEETGSDFVIYSDLIPEDD